MSKPLWQVVFDKFIEGVIDGTYPPGQILPNEQVFEKKFGVSRGTIRRAFHELEQRKVIERRQNRGTIVIPITPETALFRFFRFRDDKGKQIVPSLVENEVIHRNSTRTEKRLLNASPAKVFEINRVRAFKKTVIGVEQSIVSAELFHDLDRKKSLPNALYVLFQKKYSIAISSVDEKLTAEPMPTEIAEKLNVLAGTPAFVLERISYDILGRAVELRKGIYLTKNMHYSVRIG